MTKSILTLTPTAINQVEQLLNKNANKVFRIWVRDEGCSGKKYKLKLEDTTQPNDLPISVGKAKVYIAEDSVSALMGTVIDCKIDKTLDSWKWIFNNPNAYHSCGCGESFSVNKELKPSGDE